ncbi:hypothetical protein RB653_005955 [Dictyostelium firmibasis]|uniref:Galactose oxidase n=1 Tax=Dictyostelium firmibasis TaxID=79012 RepID=A0AAN7YZS2_9MYCE
MNKSLICVLLLSFCLFNVSKSFNNFVTDSWISIVISGLENAPKPVSLHSAALNPINNTMIVFGGKDSNHVPNNNVTIYDLIQDSWLEKNTNSNHTALNLAGSIPSPRYGHIALTNSDNKMYIFGGRNQTNVFNDIYKYNMITDNWELIIVTGNLPKARWGHSGVVYSINNCFYIYGGSNTLSRDGPFLNDIIKFDFERNEWIQMTPTDDSELFAPKIGLFLHTSVFTLTNEMIVFGGKYKNGNQSSTVSDVTYIFDADNEKWVNATLNSTSSIPDARYGHTAVLTPLGTMLVFAGNDSTSNAVSSVWRYHIAYGKWDFVSSIGSGGPDARSGHTSITTLFNTMITFGGQSSGTKYYNDLYKYNIINSVLRSSSDGTTLVVLLSLVGAMIIGLCFALDYITEKNEIARLERLEKDAIAKNNELELKKIKKERKEKQLQPLFEKF